MTAHSKPARDGENLEHRLEKGLEDSFPASDPPAVTRPGAPESDEAVAARKKASEKKEAQSDALDEALEETFPASDPPAITTPHGATGPEVVKRDKS